jgi:hypothetical protein
VATTAATGDEPIKIEIAETPDQRVEVDSANIVTMETTAKSFWRRLNGDFNFGAMYTKGNESTQYNISGSAEYPSEKWSAQTTFNSTLSSSTLAPASKRNQLGFNVVRMFRGENNYVAGIADFLQSNEQSINLQSSVGGGFGHYFKNTSRTRISVIGGIAYQKTNYDDTLSTVSNTQNTIAALVSLRIRLFRFKKTKLEATATLLPSLTQPGRFYFKTNDTYYVKLFSNVTWNFSFYGNWDNRPPGHLTGSDYGLSSGLGWTFGNK